MAPVYASWETNGQRILHWVKLISITGSTQILIQAIGLIVGIMTVRLLPVKEYAWFIIANTILGAINILSDGGITNGVMALGGKVWPNKENLGKIYATSLGLRRKSTFICLFISIPILFYLLINNGADFLTATLITIAIIPAVFASISDLLIEVVFKLHQAILPLQKNQLLVALLRLFMTVYTILIFPFAFVAIIGAGLPRIWGNFQMQKKLRSLINCSQISDKKIKFDILLIVKRSLPTLIYYSFSAQISVWIFSLMGSTTSLAQIGALGRFPMVLNLITTVFAVLIVPRFARMEEVYSRLALIYSIVIISFILISLLIIGICYFSSDYLIMILGEKYTDLSNEVVLIMIAACINMTMSSGLFLYQSRGWVMSPYLSVGLSCLTLVLGFFIFNVSTLTGILYYNIFISLVQMVLHLSYGFFRIIKLN